MGTVAIGAGAMDDASAWCLLAVVIASFDANPQKAIWNVVGGIAFVAIVMFLIKPVLDRFQRYMISNEEITENGLVVCLALMALGAWFGAFMVGAAIPRGVMSRDLTNRIQPLAVTLLLPLFFTYSGLNTKIGLLNTGFLWAICGLVLLAAVLGKGVACWLAARSMGISNREAMGIGILMNARGLMELIIINIGLQRGIISEGLFATLVIMAVITTLMASPLFELMVGGEAESKSSASVT
jgi:Kef-type K+ transport system membrane component KefB